MRGKSGTVEVICRLSAPWSSFRIKIDAGGHLYFGEMTNTEFLRNLEGCRGELLAYCRHLLWKKENLEDAVQEVLLQAIPASSRFIPGTDFRKWLLKVATFTIYNINRRSDEPAAVHEIASEEVEREIELEDAYAAALRDPERLISSLGGGLRRAIEGLNRMERTVLLLRSICELKYQEIAEILEVPLGTVMGNLGRARAKIRRALAGKVHEM